MDFEAWLTSNNYDSAALNNQQRRHLQAAWRSELPFADLPDGQSREDAIRAAAAKYLAGTDNAAARSAIDAVAKKATDEGWTIPQAQLELLRASRETGLILSTPRGEAGDDVLATAMALTAGIREDVLLKTTSPRVLEAARSPALRGFSWHGLVTRMLAGHGESPVGRIQESHVKRAFDLSRKGDMMSATLSTGVNLTTILSNLAEKTLLSSYMHAPAPWRSFAATRVANNFKTHTALRPSFDVVPAKLALAGEVTHGTAAEESYEYSVDTYARQLTIDRREVVNDDLQAFAEVLPAMGRGAARALNDLVANTILTGAAAFWTAARANYDDGATDSVLSAAGLNNALQMLRNMKDAADNFLDLSPAVLLCPSTLEQTARALLESSELLRDVSSDDQLPTGNTFKGLAILAVDPRLGDTTFNAAASTTHWWLFSSPSNAAVIVAFLDGMQQPTLETFDYSADIDKLAMGFRVYHDFGCALADYRASIMLKGAA